MRISIQQRTDYQQLYSIISQNVCSREIYLDLKINFFNPVDVLIVTKFLIFQLKNRCKIFISIPNEEHKRYLKAIGLIDFCRNNFEESNTIEGINSYTAMPIKRVSTEKLHSYIEATQSYFAQKCPTKDLSGLNISIAELINNVYDHSGSAIDAYVFCQFYPKINTIKVAVSDLGIGIPTAVNSYLRANNKPVLPNSDTIEWALTLLKTIKSHPKNQGRGLDTVNSFMLSNRSSWSLYSGNIKMAAGVWGRTFSSNPIENFIGTVIELNIKINNLEEKDDTDYLDPDPWSW